MNDVERCVKHPFERTSRFCGSCGHSYCDDCLVQPFPRKPPLCKSCAMAVAGIRTTGTVAPVRTKKEIKALHKERTQPAPDPAPTKRVPSAIEAATAPARPARRVRMTRREKEQPPAVNRSAFILDPDVVPPGLGATKVPARTKRLWRAAG